MIAIIATGGKQYLVKTGDVLKVEKLEATEGSTFTFDKVLMKSDEAGALVELGKPYLDGVTVKAEVLKQGRAPKVRVEKFKRKVRTHKVYGHRQPFTQVKIVG